MAARNIHGLRLQYFILQKILNSNIGRPLSTLSCAKNFTSITSNSFRDLNIQHLTQRYKCSKPFSTDCFIPLNIEPPEEEEELQASGFIVKMSKDEKLKILNNLFDLPMLYEVALENGLDENLFTKSCISFRSYCLSRDVLPLALNVTMSDILTTGNADNPASLASLIPYFLQHTKNIFPHLTCLNNLKEISDLRHPANWYSEARDIKRKIIFHSGPTNSGKTYHALKRFTEAKTGLYCGPLKLLAVEVFNKTNELGTPCDLITGEERQYAIDKDHPADHLACTIEMASTRSRYEVAVIDEIQMIRDPSRGWAWTRALLGLAADEIHVCGEEAAVKLVSDLVEAIYEPVEVHRYNRLTELVVEDKSLDSLVNVRPGDCIVCFSKNDIYKVNIALERMGYQCAVIYGSLPPGAKMTLTRKFNDPNDPCKILVATDAIGMGLNLSIQRIIFYSLTKPSINEEGKKEMGLISPSQALQIAGRAGRYGTVFSKGRVTTFHAEDLPVLRDLMAQPVEPIQTAGIHPPAEQIEAFAFHLPQATLSNLVEMFVNLSQLDNVKYHLCDMEAFKVLADLIQPLDLDLRTRYTLCTAPINQKAPLVTNMFRKFAAQFSQHNPITWSWLMPHVKYPFRTPHTIGDLSNLESVFDLLDLYLWLSYRFPDMFPDVEMVRMVQRNLDGLIQHGIVNLTRLIKAGNSSARHQSDGAEIEEGSPNVVSRPARQRKGKLLDHLLAQGILNRTEADELRRELEKDIIRKKISPRKKY